MKKMMLFCLVAFLPMLILARPEGMMFGRQADRIAKMGNRAYRMSQITSFNYFDNEWTPSGHEASFFNPVYHAQRDSSSYSTWYAYENQWYHDGTEIYFWNYDGRMTAALWIEDGAWLTWEAHMEYDAQGRLVLAYEQGYDYNGNPIDTWRVHYFWTPSDLVVYQCEEYEGDIGYHKIDCQFDPQGRMTTMDSYSSSDSLNWAPEWRNAWSYHANDSSDFSDFAAMITDYFYYDLGYQEACGYNHGYMMLAQEEKYEWSDRGWVCHWRNNHTWNAADQLIKIESENDWDGFWQPESKHEFSYDGSGNVNLLECFYWQDSAWVISSKYLPSWDYYSSADDPSSPAAPSVSLKLWPQPFQVTLNIQPSSDKAGIHKIGIYDLRGRLIRSLSTANDQPVIWDGRDGSGSNCASGIYLIRTEQEGRQASSRTVKIK